MLGGGVCVQSWSRVCWADAGLVQCRVQHGQVWGGGASAGVDLVGEVSFFRFVPTFGEDAPPLAPPPPSPLRKYGIV